MNVEELNMAVDPLTALTASVGLYNFAEKNGLFDFLRSRHKVLVLGPSGVGKTQMIESFKNIIPEVIPAKDRTEIEDELGHNISIQDVLFEFLDTPGEDLNEAFRNQFMKDHKDIKLVMNVVCYGYHEYEDALLTESVNPIGKDHHVSEEFLENSKKREVERLSEWVSTLTEKYPELKIITVVTKADLWRDEYYDVMSHYKQGSYHTTLMEAHQGKHKKLHVVPYCSVSHNFYDDHNNKGTRSHMDDTQRKQLRSYLFQKVFKLIGEKK